ncbi:MAG TPA: urease accessory UreF family protein [Nocardioides sp.]|uniref:urease accessory protein UreF n=1 Tax=Nocardioides sp. TaxID=35761 RepID=UPI002B605256|nr:urease accessory UreF family protein [Nocardioides sp.]HTW15932.1 urease accessory UreF family protein [Nocardioides sp.]
MTPSPELMMMLMADARLPVAGHTQSGSLEPAVRAGLTAAHVPVYVRTRLRTVTRVEAGTAVVARHRLLADLPLEPLETAWEARTPSAAMRATSRAQAQALLRLVVRLWPEHPAVAAVRTLPAVSRPVALGAMAVAAGLDAASLARVIGYDDAQTVASAALKLLPLDPATATGWVHAALGDIDRLADDVATLTCPTAVPAAAMPQVEAWAEAHAVSSRRLFSA